jgi:hypothetical protein
VSDIPTGSVDDILLVDDGLETIPSRSHASSGCGSSSTARIGQYWARQLELARSPLFEPPMPLREPPGDLAP